MVVALDGGIDLALGDALASEVAELVQAHARQGMGGDGHGRGSPHLQAFANGAGGVLLAVCGHFFLHGGEARDDFTVQRHRRAGRGGDAHRKEKQPFLPAAGATRLDQHDNGEHGQEGQ